MPKDKTLYRSFKFKSFGLRRAANFFTVPAPQSTSDLIHSILSNVRPKEENHQPAKPQQPSASPISSILSNFKPQANATQTAPAQTAAKPSTNDLISNILSNAKKKK